MRQFFLSVGVLAGFGVALPAMAQSTQSQPAQNQSTQSQPAQKQPANNATAAKPASAPSKSRKAIETEQNPFPEAASQAAEKKQQAAESSGSQEPLQLQPIPGVSSSKSQMSPEDLGETKIKHSGRQDEFTRDLNPAGRLHDDLQVADFYSKDWNYRGAYLRYQDALQLDPGNEVALFGVADMECEMKQSAQALAGFKTYLEQYPTGKYAKKAEKILKKPEQCSAKP
jgi:hypothetical protein